MQTTTTQVIPRSLDLRPRTLIEQFIRFKNVSQVFKIASQGVRKGPDITIALEIMVSQNVMEPTCKVIVLGTSPGLVVMGRDSHLKGRGFESPNRILDGHFFTYVCCKNCYYVCLKRLKINEKEAGVGPFYK